jgi:hypothetical protein
LAARKKETDQQRVKQLEAFVQHLKDRVMCSFWGNSDQLELAVFRGLNHETEENPQMGWIRADQLPSEVVLTENMLLNKRVRDLEHERDRLRGPKEAIPFDELAFGDDEYTLRFEWAGTTTVHQVTGRNQVSAEAQVRVAEERLAGFRAYREDGAGRSGRLRGAASRSPRVGSFLPAGEISSCRLFGSGTSQTPSRM